MGYPAGKEGIDYNSWEKALERNIVIIYFNWSDIITGERGRERDREREGGREREWGEGEREV